MQLESTNSGASSSLSAYSPGFTGFSSKNLADIAARVVHELNLSPDDDFFFSSLHPDDAVKPDRDDNQNAADVDDEFEFMVLSADDTSSPISADDIFHNGQIKPTYPLFNTELVYGYKNDVVSEGESKTTSSSNVIENDSVSATEGEDAELEGVPQGNYCVWVPAALRKKSNSTGSPGVESSKRWRLRDLIHRSNSDGKENFVFFTPSHRHRNRNDDGGETKRKEKVGAGNGVYGKKTEEVKKKKSHLRYRQELLVGYIGNVNGLSRTIRPF